jgi:dTDP-4-amino-4,6-dideoxygalactose transaminase
MRKPVYVTQPYLPPLEEFYPYLQQIWDSKVLTNCGPFHQQLEQTLCAHLGIKHLALFTNATIALVTALQAMRITGEVIYHALFFCGNSAFVALERHQAGFLSTLTPIRSTWTRQKLNPQSPRKPRPSCLFTSTDTPAM